MRQGLAVLFHSSTPTELLEAIEDRVQYWNAVPFLFSKSVDYSGPFVVLHVVAKGSKPTKIYIPASYVLAIYDMSEGDLPFGFHKKELPPPAP